MCRAMSSQKLLKHLSVWQKPLQQTLLHSSDKETSENTLENQIFDRNYKKLQTQIAPWDGKRGRLFLRGNRITLFLQQRCLCV